jgi:prolyl 4-hydroxylase
LICDSDEDLKIMISQAITAELRQWIIQQATTGKSAHEVLKSMLASGWNEDVAVTAMEETLRDHLQTQQVALPLLHEKTPGRSQVFSPPSGGLTRSDRSGGSHAQTPGRSQVFSSPSGGLTRSDRSGGGLQAMPKPVLTSAHTIRAGDRDVQVLTAIRHPHILVLSGVLADNECDALIEMAQGRLQRAQTVQKETGGNMQHEARTSEGMFFSRGENALCQTIEARMAALMNWPVENGEGLQILRYGPGAEYKPHYDYFDTTQPGTPKILERGGQRLASLVCYLNTPEQGGATIFPDIGLDVSPVKGNAVYFSYDKPDPSTLTLHGGAPVLAGEKWVATKWARARAYV